MSTSANQRNLPKGRESFVFFVTCAPGLEGVLHAEVRELEFSRVERQVGGVRFSGTLEDAWRANLWLRTAIRVLLRVDRFEARDADELYRAVQRTDWTRWLRVDSRFVVDAQSRESRLDHSQFVAQRVKDAIVDAFREKFARRPSVDKATPDVSLHVHVWRDRCTLSIDTSGESLHKRGWRKHQGRAPLAETTAAAIVLLSGWDRRSPLVDPFAGSGTILVEAASIAAGRPPGAQRERFGFEGLPEHDAAKWSRMRERALASAELPKKVLLLGLEADSRTLELARENFESAGFGERIALESARAESYEYKRGWNAWIVTNPPYGERVGDERALGELYRALGARWRERCGGWHVALLSGNPKLAKLLALEGAQSIALENGALACDLLTAELAR